MISDDQKSHQLYSANTYREALRKSYWTVKIAALRIGNTTVQLENFHDVSDIEQYAKADLVPRRLSSAVTCTIYLVAILGRDIRRSKR